MNTRTLDILKILLSSPFVNQRTLADQSGYALGTVNQSLKSLVKAGYLDDRFEVTDMARQEAARRAPRSAIILAAGFGMRMVPINVESPKGLLDVKGEPLIDRLIKQLHAVGITQIQVVVGFMKERFEYLMDTYGVDLIVNPDYATTNNLHSLAKALKFLSNAYIVPSDIWCRDNPFSRDELYSWYMVSDRLTEESTVRVNRRLQLDRVANEELGHEMIGISYLLEDDAARVRDRVRSLSRSMRQRNAFWEEALFEGQAMRIQARVVPSSDAVEFNTFEQLREFDSDSSHLHSKAIDVIAHALNTGIDDIKDIRALKKGMTNRSFLFGYNDRQYIMRIPGEGTDKLINRRQEAAVYDVIKDKKLCDDIIHLDPATGYKLTGFIPNARTCDAESEDDLVLCMDKLRQVHELALKVPHQFDIFGQIGFYESLWQGQASVYADYDKTKAQVLSLRPFIAAHAEPFVLTHIDAVPDNFLIVEDAGQSTVTLIDWEYAGMQDPHVDIAMFCIYALYRRPQVDRLIDIYFKDACTLAQRAKVYCYIASCGLLWSNWCEYKRQLGVDFGDYSLRQYRYAKDYYHRAKELIDTLQEGTNHA